MKNLRFHTIVVFAVLIVSLLSIFPVEENLRLGKDLAGGVSLIYTVDVKPEDGPDTIERTINVLKDRVNPQGLFEIAFQQMGRDRIEITMPLPNERVQQLRREFEASLAKLRDFSVDADSFLRAMRLTGAEREAALEALMGTPAQRELLAPVADAIKKAEEARAAYAAAQAAGVVGPEADTLLDAAGEAEVALDLARDRVLSSLVSMDDVRAALELPEREHRIQDRETKEIVALPSPRAEALNGIRERLKPMSGSGTLLDEILEVHGRYVKNRKSLDDPNDLVRLLQGAGVLNFRIAVIPGTRADEAQLRQEVRERGPGNVKVDGAAWYRLNSIDNWFNDTQTLRALRDDAAAYFASRYGLIVEPRDGLFYALLHDNPGMRLTSAEGQWSLRSAFPTSDELGKPAIAFQMDPRGGVLLGNLTEQNIRRQMAIVLDDQVISAPSIESRISDNGRITGNFSQEEIGYLIKTMSAGSLQAKLGDRPISQSVLAPELGADNLRKGLDAAWIAFIAIGVFMLVYYFFSGAIAMVALIVNALIILGLMSLNRAAFTLPGIAGVVLTFGTAVDANVLIYERIREELRAGNDMRAAVRIAFKRVGSTIIDANLTNLIVCLVLIFTGTQEIKGFGVTLGMGVIATLFCAIIVTRLIFVLLVDKMKAGPWVINQLPVALPFIQRALTPNVNWMRLFPLFVVVSLVLCAMGAGFVVYEGNKLLDSEFRGGTSVTLQLKEGDNGERLTLKRADVEERVRKVAAEAGEGQGALVELRNAEVVPVNPLSDGVTSDRFTVRTTSTDEVSLRAAMVEAFGDVVESRPAIAFKGSDAASAEGAPIVAISEARLGANIGRPDVQNDVGSYLGGVIIMLDQMDPAPTRASLEARLDYMRADPQYSATALRREHQVIVLDGSDDAVRSAAVVVHDSRFSVFEDEPRWRAGLASEEWGIVRDALTQPTVLASVNSFSPAIAATFRAQAIIAVLLSFILISIYVWVRFGSVRYSLAAVLPVLHDSLIAIGFVALAEILYENFPIAAQLGIRPIKIDLGLVAAIMTIIGYSLNDTIVILDRIRENRGKLAYASAEVINNSINQTMSRTIVTGGTALVSLFVLFFVGGEGVSSFAYTMIVGMIVGTYSSIAVAAPIVYSKHVPAAPTYTPDSDESPDRRLLPGSAGI